MKRWIVAFFTLLMCVQISLAAPPPKPRIVKVHTNLGVMTLELDVENAPNTVKNFMEYVNSGFYSNTIFHRVIDGFVIQGGGFDSKMQEKLTSKPIHNEAANGLRNDKYTVAMARMHDPHSATAQFYINLKDNPSLNYSKPVIDGYGYCVFGKVTSGMDVVDAIGKSRTGSRSGYDDVPLKDVVITKVEVVQ